MAGLSDTELLTAKHRTKKELARLVRRLDPLPEVPSRIEPLGPAPSHLLSPAPTWSQSVAALNPIRELEPGARPRDWMDWTQSAASANDGSSGTRSEDGATPSLSPDEPALATLARVDVDARPAELALARLEPQRYRVQFEASEDYVELIERAKALLSHAAPRPDLGDLHLRAMRALVIELEREKYAVTTRQRVARPPQLVVGGAARRARNVVVTRMPVQKSELGHRADRTRSEPEHQRRAAVTHSVGPARPQTRPSRPLVAHRRSRRRARSSPPDH